MTERYLRQILAEIDTGLKYAFHTERTPPPHCLALRAAGPHNPWRRGLAVPAPRSLPSGRTARAIFALLLTIVTVPLFVILFAWIAPGWLFRWPVHDYPVPPIFFPAILGCFIVAPLLIRWVTW
jgi:hypothetical protein